jgi:hypothetical protein
MRRNTVLYKYRRNTTLNIYYVFFLLSYYFNTLHLIHILESLPPLISLLSSLLSSLLFLSFLLPSFSTSFFTSFSTSFSSLHYRSLHELQPQLRMDVSKANKELLVARDSPSRYLNLPYVSSMVSTERFIRYEGIHFLEFDFQKTDNYRTSNIKVNIVK